MRQSMKAAIYTSQLIDRSKIGDTPVYNWRFFPCHPAGTSVIYLAGGNYPKIEKTAQASKIKVKPFSDFEKDFGGNQSKKKGD